MTSSSARDRIRALIESARAQARQDGRDLDLDLAFRMALARCGVGSTLAAELLSDPDRDRLKDLLHFAGESHGLAALAMEEALKAA